MQKPRKKPMKGTRTHTLRKSMKMTLGAGMPIHECVRLPPGENKLEWIAMNSIPPFHLRCSISIFFSEVLAFYLHCTTLFCSFSFFCFFRSFSSSVLLFLPPLFLSLCVSPSLLALLSLWILSITLLSTALVLSEIPCNVFLAWPV